MATIQKIIIYDGDNKPINNETYNKLSDLIVNRAYKHLYVYDDGTKKEVWKVLKEITSQGYRWSLKDTHE